MRVVYGFFLLLTGPMTLAAEQLALQDPRASDPELVVYLDQNWTQEDREKFYFLNQGSRLFPYQFFLHLEQAESPDLFRSDANMLRFGFLPEKASKLNPHGLPIGFARDDDFVGPTCAACHTQLLKYKDHYIRIDGGQSMADLPMFLSALTAAIRATLTDQDKWQRFSGAVLGEKASQTELDALRQALQTHFVNRQDYNRRNHSDVAYGYSRLDAFGAILNKGLNLTGVPDNFNPPDAPTSYPYIWDTPQHDYVEWNGSQSNSSLGALARNVGEVIGVYGQVIPKKTRKFLFFDGGYESSVKTRNLRLAEKQVSKLQSPLWPAFFPKINQAKAEQGRSLYQTYCVACHTEIDRSDPGRTIKVRMSTLDYIQTDPVMARNAVEFRGKTGILEGEPRYYSKGEKLGSEAAAIYIVNNVMGGVLKNNPLQTYLAIHDAKKAGHPEVIHPPKYVNGVIIEEGQEVSKRALLAYKARPLNGVWSSAPFLHNGSVPNLYELLLPAEQRSEVFYIGSWEYDPVRIGYIQQEQPGAFRFDTQLKGNSNAGHEYGTGKDGLPVLSNDQRWMLLEYLKTL